MMPCREERDYPDFYKNETARLEAEVSRLTKMLCFTCGMLDYYNYDFSGDFATDSWWRNHKNEDNWRKEVEMKKLEENKNV